MIQPWVGVRGGALLFLVLWSAFGVPALGASDVIARTYTWEYAGQTWSFEYTFPAYEYHLQSSLARTLDYTIYGVYITDPLDDAILRDFVSKLEMMAGDLDVWQRLNLLITLVQSIPYASESCEYPRYPLEMLIDGQGDCEDAAILTAALVQYMGFDVVLLAFLLEHHMAVGIRVLPPQHQTRESYAWNKALYFYVEPTSPGWEIGERPAMYQSQPVIIGLPPIVAASSR